MGAHANHDHAPTPTLRGMKRVAAGVAASHPATARAGLQVLRDGGTAADAAVAAVLACCVAETIFTGLGGGGFATYFEAATGTVTCLDFFCAVPGLDGDTTPGPMLPSRSRSAACRCNTRSARRASGSPACPPAAARCTDAGAAFPGTGSS